jgi:hypothetical protein
MRSRPRLRICCVLISCALSLASSYDAFEEMLGDVEEDEDYIELLNLLDAAAKQPVNLLEADRRTIAGLPWVSPWLAAGIIKMRREGRLKTLEDLALLDGVDERLVELLRPFAIVRPLRRAAPPLKGMVRLRVISSPASSSMRRLKTYLRGEMDYQGLSGGFVLEKDRGEADVNDFQAYHLTKRWSRLGITIGDFMIASGHGLVFSNPYGHSPSTVSPWRYGRGRFGIRPYTTVDENFALEGMGLAWASGGFEVCALASHATLDANLGDDGKVVSLRTTGVHTSSADSLARDALREKLAGLAVRWAKDGLEARCGVSYADFDRDFQSTQVAGLTRTGNLIGGLDLTLVRGETILFAEGATSRRGGEAVIGGLACDTSHLEFLLLGRAYGHRYVSLHSKPFAFYSGIATGERGLLTQVRFTPLRRVAFAVGNDLHDKHEAETGLARPSGSQSFADLEIGAGKVMIALKEKLLRSEIPPSAEGRPTQKRSRLRSRIDASYKSGRTWVRVRYENLRSHKETDSAVASSSDLVRLDARLAIGKAFAIKSGAYVFTVGSYDSRIYQYEAGLPYYPALQMLQKDGTRCYSVVSAQSECLGSLALKAARSAYDDDTERVEFLFYYTRRM